MITNHFIIALRNMRKNKLDTILNLSGLSLGLTLCILIIFHIQDELSYDQHFPKADRLYRVSCEMREGDNVRHWATTSPMIPEYITQSFPEIDQTCRLFVLPPQILSYKPDNGTPQRVKESSGFFADQSSIDMFDFEFITGDPKTALDKVNSIVLSQATAEKFFPDRNPLGELLSFPNGNNAEVLLKVTGVIKNVPSNTHFDFAYLVSFPTFYTFLRDIGQEQLAHVKTWAAMYNYVLVKDQNPIHNIEARLSRFTTDYLQGMGSNEEILSRVKFNLQPIVAIHLHSKLEQEFKANSDIALVYVFSAIAFFILLIVAVNFVNISTAQALNRVGEIGIRKVLGIGRIRLLWQMTSESLFLICLAIASSFLLTYLFLPLYNLLSGKSYILANVFQRSNITVFLSLFLFFGLLTSIVPALFTAGFNPIQSIKGVRDPLSTLAKTRKGLVVFQFTVSIFMIFGTLIIHQQMHYFQNKELGFDKDNVIAISLNNDLQDLALQKPEILKNELIKNPAIVASSVISNLPGDRLSIESLRVPGADMNNQGQFRFIRVDHDYAKVLNLKIVEGSDFSTIPENSSAFLINERAAQALQIDNPVGRPASTLFGTQGEIVGIIKDFHFASLHNTIEPLVIEHFPKSHQLKSALSSYLLLRLDGSDMRASIHSIKATLKEIAPGALFNYTFLDQTLNSLYESEQRMSNLFKAFALFAIFISCLGLFGLSSYTVQLRVKEIGIRRTLGASLPGIIHLLSKRYIAWIVLANVLALPLGWFCVNEWLQNFAYRTQIGGLPFILTLFISVGMALFTTSYHAFKTARANPVEALRYE